MSTSAHETPAAVFSAFIYSYFDSSDISSCVRKLLRKQLKYKFYVKVEESTELFNQHGSSLSKTTACSIPAINVLFPNSVFHSLKQEKCQVCRTPFR